MLQARLENEQFNSLPSLITTDRSRLGFITTDRPDSSQLVDLHIYIIPKSVWKDVQHLAQNESMEDAISAGFVRVSPNMKIRDLRESIEQLCGNEDYFPRDFIFLRSVGRCMTRVKARQENELKVKNYRPPQTFAAEIYLLEGRHEDYAHIPCASPALSSASYVFGHRHQSRFNHHDNSLSPTRLHQNYGRRPIRGGKHYSPTNAHDLLSHAPSSGRHSWTKYTQIGSDPEDTSTNVSLVTSVTLRDSSKLKEEQERLRRRQAELERMRRAAEEKKAQAEREEEERRRRQEKAEAERRRLEQEKAEAERRRLEQERAEAERRRLQQQEAAATRIQASYRGFKSRQAFKERKRNNINDDSRILSSKSDTTMKEKIKKNEEETDIDDDDLSDGTNRLDRVKEVEEENETSNKNQWSSQGFRRRSLLIPTPIENRHEIQKLSSPKGAKSDYNNNEYEDIQNEISQILSRSSSIESISHQDSSNTTQIERPIIKKERTESINSNSSSLLSRKKTQSNFSTHSKTQETVDTVPFIIDSPVYSTKNEKNSHDDERNTRNKIVNKQRQFSPESSRRTTPEIIKPEEKIINDEIELERREAEARRRRQLEEEEQKRKARELEEQRRRESEEQRRRELAKRQREDPETLRARLQELRTRRADLEKIREEVIKHLKNIHNRITLRRKEARDMWKKKYFVEKKKTPPLEERVILLKTDIEQIHKKTVQTIDAEAKHATQLGYTKEGEIGNLIVQVTRTHHDIQDIRHQVEQAKLRLTTDVKLRNQAENECRSLRHELNQAKMNLNHIKTRVAV